MNQIFKYWPGDKAVNPLQVEGIITMAAVDDAGQVKYYVETATGGSWWLEAVVTVKAREGENPEA